MLKRNPHQVAVFNGKEWQLDYTLSNYIRIHLARLPFETFVVQAHHQYRPDLIALDAYGDPASWWVIGFANGIINPQRDFKIGDNLRIPDKTAVLEMLQNRKSSVRQLSNIGRTLEV